MWQDELPRGFLHIHTSPEKQLTKKLWQNYSAKGCVCLSCCLSVLITSSITVQDERESEKERGREGGREEQKTEPCFNVNDDITNAVMQDSYLVSNFHKFY